MEKVVVWKRQLSLSFETVIVLVVVVSLLGLWKINIFSDNSSYDASDSNHRRKLLNVTSITRAELQLVNGLRNDDIVMVVASTSKDGGKFLRDRVIPSARTWMRLLNNVFVVVEDTFETRFSLRHCSLSEHGNLTAFACQDEPTYVLTRECTNEYYNAPGICCKFDETINFLANTNNKLYEHMKYLIQCDDDSFWRVDQLMRWLSLVEKAGFQETPLIGNLDNSRDWKPQQKGGIYHVKGCEEVLSNGWYQPLMLNKKAIEKIKVSTASYATTQTCKNFVLSQDAGIGVFAWIHQLYHIKIPGVALNENHKGVEVFRPHQMIVHGVKHGNKDDCEGKRNWPKHLRYDQNVSIGCGKLGVPHPYHDPNKIADMYDAWNYFARSGKNVEVGHEGVNDFVEVEVAVTGGVGAAANNQTTTTTTRIIPKVVRLPGYESTEHAKKYNVTAHWVEFTLRDCKIPGIITKDR